MLYVCNGAIGRGGGSPTTISARNEHSLAISRERDGRVGRRERILDSRFQRYRISREEDRRNPNSLNRRTAPWCHCVGGLPSFPPGIKWVSPDTAHPESIIEAQRLSGIPRPLKLEDGNARGVGDFYNRLECLASPRARSPRISRSFLCPLRFSFPFFFFFNSRVASAYYIR